LASADRHSPQFYLPGHYSSPIPDLRQVRADASRIFTVGNRHMPGIDLREEEQMVLLQEFETYYAQVPWKQEVVPGLRYHFGNDWYEESDAIFLYSMIRHAGPSRIVEIGSGFSSAVTLDTNDQYFGGAIKCTFIEPYPDRLLGLLTEADRSHVDVIQKRLEDVELEIFRSLKSGDILFIDSSHVAKVGSDVNRYIFEVFPLLASGVFVHIHDIFYPFEYPEEWVMRGWAWNEAYMLRAFLSFNDRFRIVAFNTYLEQFHEEWFRKNMPLCLANTGGSIWLQVQ
jgi:predicted O-methyltransferase YrrM